ncbi:MAG TPA: hypothetical protein VIA62_22835 [Thermoanaerobaculia bacterium]|jgi:hypothetical protein|nr:hypothetical protein [Thermoanaerobaculia bacterium]
MKRYLLIPVCALLAFCPSRVIAQVDCATIAQEEILHCDNPSDPTVQNIAGLSLQRGANYHCYREPRIVITRANNAQEVYPVSGSKWQYGPNNQNVQTIFTGGNANAQVTFTLNSTTGFSPLSGSITIGSKTITFRTCGVQRTSAYYWTKSSQNKLEAFSCPVSKIPPGCPKVGYNP